MALDPDAIRAVVEGEHGDPFAVLGPHRVETPHGAAMAVRAMVPGAAAVRVLPAGAPPTPMERLHPAGFFETVLVDRCDLFAYRLEVTRDGHTTEIEDPYRFPSLVGDFSGWDGRSHPMRLHRANGIWEIFVPGLQEGERYKFEIRGRSAEPLALKSDPYAFAFEAETPRTASVVADLDEFRW